MSGSSLVQRLVAALRLDLQLYEDVSADAAASGQAFRIVLLAGVSNGLALVRQLGSAGIVAGVGAALLGWLLWAAVIRVIAGFVGQRRPERSLLRALGFANAPGVFLILGRLPVIGPLVRYAVVAWLVATTVRAVQATFGLTARRALAVSILGFLVYLALGVVSAYFAPS
ncbi:MAG TPA: YIP1 family protein [Candidatus Margulisiibacteriota bacterium]|nr:YIP1 family protein [Candidatus Margulisiibacteriota bacterium]